MSSLAFAPGISLKGMFLSDPNSKRNPILSNFSLSNKSSDRLMNGGQPNIFPLIKQTLEFNQPSYYLKSCQTRKLNCIRAEASVNGAVETKKSSALVLIRHGESLWNSKNLFTGCVDVPLSQKGVDEALEAGKRICDIPVDLIFTSALIRAQMTAMLAMIHHKNKKVPVILHQESDQAISWSKIFSQETEEKGIIPVVTAWELNERMYGELQGLNKKETADKYGADMVLKWRRSYDIPPPNGESLEMCAKRAVKYFKENVEPQLQQGKNVLIAAHGNSLRSIIMYLDDLTSKQVIELELATGVPMLYDFKDNVFTRKGSPIGPSAMGVYALTPDLADYKKDLDIAS